MFSGWFEVLPCHKSDALTVTKKLLENVFPTWGLPSAICSDRGTHFTGQIIRALPITLQTSWNDYWPYHPQSSGKVEKTNGIVKLKISTLVETTGLP